MSFAESQLRSLATSHSLMRLMAVALSLFSVLPLSADTALSSLTDEERVWLEQHPVIRHAPDPDYAPFEYCDDQGVARGIAPDYLAMISESLGVKIESKCGESWARSLGRVKERDAELVTVATKTPERSEYMLFTAPYLVLPDVILVRATEQSPQGMDDLRGRTIAVIKGWAANAWMKEKYPDVTQKLVPDVATALNEVSFGRVDATILGLATASHGIEQAKITNLKVAGETGYVYYISLASRSDWPMLNRILDKALLSIGDSRRDSVFNKWVSLRVEGWRPGPGFWIGIGIGLVFAVLLVFVAWNISLRRTVHARTIDLQRELQERERAESELLRERRYLNGVIDAMPSVMLAIDSGNRVTQWNREATRFTGFEVESALGRQFEDVVSLPPNLIEAIKAAARKRKAKKLDRQIFIDKGEKCLLDITIYPVAMESDSFTVIRLDDVTDRVRMERMIVHAEKMMSVGGLATGMAHEINNPLGGMVQGVQNIRRRLSPELEKNVQCASDLGIDFDRLQEYLSQREIFDFIDGIAESGERVGGIVNHMLSFSHQANAGFDSVDPAGLIDKTLEYAAVDYDMKKYDFSSIQLERNYKDDLPRIQCDIGGIQQVLLNLLRNAVQALHGRDEGSESPRIGINVWSEGEMLYIKLEDNGSGMDEATQKRVYEPFFTTRQPGLGMGLGLTVAYFIVVDEHHGHIEVESEPGKGSRFTISLPIHGISEAV
ncbi:MAG: transporter substrate-binding domain-containing protein [Candidatus Sedimenticola sp. 6PFRAG1]